MAEKFRLYRDNTILYEGDSPIIKTGLKKARIYPKGYYKVTKYLTNYPYETKKIDVTEFTTKTSNDMPTISDPWVGTLLPNGTDQKIDRKLIFTKTRGMDTNDILSLGLGFPRTADANDTYLLKSLKPSTSYTLEVKIRVGSDYTGATNTIGVRLRYLNATQATEVPLAGLLPANLPRDTYYTLKVTGITKSTTAGMTNAYVQIYSTDYKSLGTVSVDYDVQLYETVIPIT